jgi:hypothetical protein
MPCRRVPCPAHARISRPANATASQSASTRNGSACCAPRSGKDRLERLREPFEPVDAADQDVPDATLLELGEHLHPELRALGLLEPHTQHVTIAVDGDAQREVAERRCRRDPRHRPAGTHPGPPVTRLYPRAQRARPPPRAAHARRYADPHRLDATRLRPRVGAVGDLRVPERVCARNADYARTRRACPRLRGSPLRTARARRAARSCR